MTDYCFTRRYDSSRYYAACCTTGLLATAFFVATLSKAIFLLFGLLFAFVTVLLVASIVRGDMSGVAITEHDLTYWVTGLSSQRRSIDLADIARIQYHRFDDDNIFMDLTDAGTVKLDARHFGDVCEVIRVLRARCPHVPVDCLGGPECG